MLDRKRQIAEIDTDLKLNSDQTGELTADQERMRQNIDSLNKVSGQQQQVQAYARQLAEQETRLAGLRDRAAELRKKRSAAQTELDGLVANLRF